MLWSPAPKCWRSLSGLIWIWGSKNTAHPQIKIGLDFGFELPKNTSPPQKMKIGPDFGFELPKNTPQMKIGLECAPHP